MLRGIQCVHLLKHLCIFGLTGYGKTLTIMHLLMQCIARHIPFLVLEAGSKTEYRALKCLKHHPDPQVRKLAQDLMVFTPGSSVSPLRHNPLALQKGISRDQHIENLLDCFKGSMPMSGPLPSVLGESSELVYEQHTQDQEPPRMVDLVAAMKRTLSTKGYSRDVDSDIRAALEVRLGVLTRRSIGQVFQCGVDVPSIEELVTGHSVIELAALPQEQQCLLTLFLLTEIREYVTTTPTPMDRPVRLVIVLEEAHNVVGCSRESAASEENADPKAYASNAVCRMLAEFRALGVAIIIVDQLPSAVAPEVVKNTGSKLVFREVDKEDREILGAAMLFGPTEDEEVARLRPGEAYLFTEGYFLPCKIRTPNLQEEWHLPQPPVGGALLPHIADDPCFLKATATRAAAEATQLKREMDTFEDYRVRIANEARALVGGQPKAPQGERQGGSPSGPLPQAAQRLHRRLTFAFSVFQRDAYRRLFPEVPDGVPIDQSTQALLQNLKKRFETVVQPGTEGMLKMLDRLSGKANTEPCDPRRDRNGKTSKRHAHSRGDHGTGGEARKRHGGES